MIYFTVNEGEYHGYRARLAYNYNKDPTGPTFSKYSKFVTDAKKLFPNKFNDLSKKELQRLWLTHEKHLKKNKFPESIKR